MKKKLIVFFACILALIIGCSCWVVVSVKDVIQRSTYINNIDVSLMNTEEAKNILDSNLKYGIVSIVKDDIVVATINKEDYLLMEYSLDKIDQIRLANHSFSDNFMSLFNKYLYELKPETVFSNKESRDKLNELVYNLNLSGDINSENAYILYDDTVQEFIIVEEKIGNIIDIDKFINDINSSGNYEQDSTLNLNNYFFKPEIVSTNNELNSELDLLNSNVKFSITYSIGNKTSVVDANTYLKWAQKDEDGDFVVNENNCFIYDEESLKTYISNLMEEYNTVGLTRNFTTSKGDIVTLENGSYGHKVNKKKEIEQFLIDFYNKQNVIREPIWEQTAYVFDRNDIGNTYVEVSKEDQHVWLYVDGELKVETDCVTGCVATKHDTDSGIWRIYIMQTDKYLIGPTWKSWVSYWMRFTSDGQGLHDATWRDEFGGTIYKRNGSHGCVNLPKDKAAEIYNLVEIGTPVVVY